MSAITRVHTQTSIHEIDWQASTVTRMVGVSDQPDSDFPVADLRRDGDPVPFVECPTPVVGRPLRMMLAIRADGVLTERTTTPVAHIERFTR